MESMSITVISQKNAYSSVLCEALKNFFTNIEIHNDFLDFKADSQDISVLGVISDQNIGDAIKLAQKTSVFAIAPEHIEIDETLFEEVFRSPCRLGHMIDSIYYNINRKREHEAMQPISMGDVILNPKTSILHNDSKAVRLTEKETEIIIYLFQQNGSSVSRKKLLSVVWEYADNVETHTLETHIYRLRQKLKKELGLDNFLITDDGGYILNF